MLHGPASPSASVVGACRAGIPPAGRAAHDYAVTLPGKPGGDEGGPSLREQVARGAIGDQQGGAGHHRENLISHG